LTLQVIHWQHGVASISDIPQRIVLILGTAGMKYFLGFLVTASLCMFGNTVAAHHSFASYDFEKQITFTGVIKEFKFRNPHIAMTLVQTSADGKEEIINFPEGAPANMLVRLGLRPEMVKAGTKITAVGSPKKSDSSVYFLRKIILENGKEFAP